MHIEPGLIVANSRSSTHQPHCVDWSREGCGHGFFSRSPLLLAPNGSRGYLDGFCGTFPPERLPRANKSHQIEKAGLRE